VDRAAEATSHQRGRVPTPGVGERRSKSLRASPRGYFVICERTGGRWVHADEQMQGRWLCAIGKHVVKFQQDDRSTYVHATLRTSQEADLLMRLRRQGRVSGEKFRALSRQCGLLIQELPDCLRAQADARLLGFEADATGRSRGSPLTSGGGSHPPVTGPTDNIPRSADSVRRTRMLVACRLCHRAPRGAVGVLSPCASEGGANDACRSCEGDWIIDRSGGDRPAVVPGGWVIRHRDHRLSGSVRCESSEFASEPGRGE
jgi:hypothetical protein